MLKYRAVVTVLLFMVSSARWLRRLRLDTCVSQRSSSPSLPPLAHLWTVTCGGRLLNIFQLSCVEALLLLCFDKTCVWFRAFVAPPKDLPSRCSQIMFFDTHSSGALTSDGTP